MTNDHLETMFSKAVNGDSESVDLLILGIQNMIYNLSIRMLKNPHDAEDATQEILFKVVTSWSSFKGKSKFTTWVYKIATNYLLTTRKRALEKKEISFNYISNELKAGGKIKTDTTINEVEREILAEEVKIHCTHSMLLCLSRDYRIAFILKVILNIDSKEGAQILDITPEAYRKRVSRAKKLVREFMEGNCGLVNSENSCICNRRVEFALMKKVIEPGKTMNTNPSIGAVNKPIEKTFVKEVEEIDKVTAVFRSNPYYETRNYLVKMKNLIKSDDFKILTIT